MRRGLLRTWPGFLLTSALLGACANIIGISSYEIDPALDPDTSEGGTGEAGAADGGSNGTPVGGSAGDAQAGETGVGGGDAGAGVGGAGAECVPVDCDDELPCTVDTCEGGECVHTPDNTLCDADPGECVTCQVGIGCVASTATTLELLVNGNLDGLPKVWKEVIFDNPDQGPIIAPDAVAHTPDNSAWYASLLDPASAPLQAYAGIYQPITIPEGTAQLRVTGYYEVYPGVYAPAADDLTAGLYEPGSTTPALVFHTWNGSDGIVGPWVRFDHLAPATQLKNVVGLNVTFDVFSYTWDTEFYVDTLSLEATVCE